MLGVVRVAAAVALLPVMLVQQGLAWGADGHRMINRLAGEALPKDVPEFLRSHKAVNALEYYGPEPDRWKSPAEPELGAAGSPEHFLDMEESDLIGELPRRRYDYVRALAYAQKSHPDLALTPEKVGLQPYVTTEVWERLKSAMRDYRKLKEDHKDTKPVECEIVFLAGWLGVAEISGQPPEQIWMTFGDLDRTDQRWHDQAIAEKHNLRSLRSFPCALRREAESSFDCAGQNWVFWT